MIIWPDSKEEKHRKKLLEKGLMQCLVCGLYMAQSSFYGNGWCRQCWTDIREKKQWYRERQESTGMSLETLMSLDFPQTDISDYRVGFLDGVKTAIKLLRKGSTVRQLFNWASSDLTDWTVGTINETEPPLFVPWRKLRKAVLESYEYMCVYCESEATCVDHVIPVSRGGDYSVGNLVASCAECNARKGIKTLDECGMFIRLSPSRKINFR